MLADLPQACNVGTKRNARGHQVSWIGWKLHIDSADGGIPVSCILTSASMHDSQAAIPLAEMTAARVDSLYDLMDSAYDAVEIRTHSESLGHVPIIASNPRRSVERRQELRSEAAARRAIGYTFPEDQRYRERSTAERVNARLKDEFGGRHLRVRGHAKASCHLMFGILALTVQPVVAPATLSPRGSAPKTDSILRPGQDGMGRLCRLPGNAPQGGTNLGERTRKITQIGSPRRPRHP